MTITFDQKEMDKVKIAVIDFDGTIVEHKFPHIGKPLPEAFEVIKELKNAGWILILWTCRENSRHYISIPDTEEQFLSDAVEFCKENGIEFDGINEMPPQLEFRHGYTQKRKVYGDVYIDDKNLGGFPGWKEVKKQLL